MSENKREVRTSKGKSIKLISDPKFSELQREPGLWPAVPEGQQLQWQLRYGPRGKKEHPHP